AVAAGPAGRPVEAGVVVAQPEAVAAAPRLSAEGARPEAGAAGVVRASSPASAAVVALTAMELSSLRRMAEALACRARAGSARSSAQLGSSGSGRPAAGQARPVHPSPRANSAGPAVSA